MKRKIAIVTSSRTVYAHLPWLLYQPNHPPAINLHIISMGPHHSPEFGHTGHSVSASGNTHASKRAKARTDDVVTVECLLDSDTDVGMAKTIGVATLGLADVLGRLRPDILLIIADRYEMLAAAAAALALRLPIAHVEGGEITFGAIDDAVRNALTKMSHLHFACTRRAAERIAGMGEEPWRITFSGSLSLDALRRERLLAAAEVEKKLGFAITRDTLVCAHHPVTILENSAEEAGEGLAA